MLRSILLVDSVTVFCNQIDLEFVIYIIQAYFKLKDIL